MNIAKTPKSPHARPVLENSGYHDKTIEVTYLKPQVHRDMGTIPLGPEYEGQLAPQTPEETFIEGSRENPLQLPEFRNHTIKSSEKRHEICRDAKGEPILATVTKRLTIPGPKKQAFRGLLDSALTGAQMTSWLGMGLGVFLGWASMAPTNAGLNLLGAAVVTLATTAAAATVGGAVGAGVKLCTGFVSKMCSTNSLQWSEKDLVDTKLVGVKRKSVQSYTHRGPTYLERFTPVFDETKVGTRWHPEVVEGKPES